MRLSQVRRHCVRIIKVGERCARMLGTSRQNVLGKLPDLGFLRVIRIGPGKGIVVYTNTVLVIALKTSADMRCPCHMRDVRMPKYHRSLLIKTRILLLGIVGGSIQPIGM